MLSVITLSLIAYHGITYYVITYHVCRILKTSVLAAGVGKWRIYANQALKLR